MFLARKLIATAREDGLKEGRRIGYEEGFRIGYAEGREKLAAVIQELAESRPEAEPIIREFQERLRQLDRRAGGRNCHS